MLRSICLYCFVTKIVVYESDGAPLQRDRARQLRLHLTKHKVAGTTSTEEEKALIIPDDSVVKYSVPTDEKDEMITVRVSTFLWSTNFDTLHVHQTVWGSGYGRASPELAGLTVN